MAMMASAMTLMTTRNCAAAATATAAATAAAAVTATVTATVTAAVTAGFHQWCTETEDDDEHSWEYTILFTEKTPTIESDTGRNGGAGGTPGIGSNSQPQPNNPNGCGCLVEANATSVCDEWQPPQSTASLMWKWTQRGLLCLLLVAK
jgi:hypothetical protein